MTIQQTLESALAHHQAGRLAEAEQLYRQVLSLDPHQPDALHLLGLRFHNAGQSAAALEFIERAVALRPNAAAYRLNLAAVLEALGQLERAIEENQRAIALPPPMPEAFYNLGKIYQTLLQWDKAIECHRQAIALRPGWPGIPEALNHLGYELYRAGQTEQAITTYHDAIARYPHFAKFHMNLAAILYSQYKLDESIDHLRQAIQLQPDYFEAYNALGNSLKDTGDLAGALAAYQKALTLRPDFVMADSNRVYLLNMCPGYDSQTQLAELRQWNHRQAERFRPAALRQKTRSSASRRLRVGYVSADFRNHVVARNILPLLRHHDHRQFEIFCYSNANQIDGMTEKIRANSDHWRGIWRLNDLAAADLIRADQIDILVDLGLHTSGNRLPIFARRPAPLQITFAGYPGGTGLWAMDWRLTDPYLDPPGKYDQDYSERSYRLANSFWCYDPAAMSWEPEGTAPPPLAELPAVRNGFITFGSLNNFCKVNETVLSLWSRVFQGAEHSHLRLLAPAGAAQHRVLAYFASTGINTDRIQFVLNQPRPKYLAEFNNLDISLDTFPYNGHTTSLDAMWMGVPVVSRLGQTVVGRAGWSQASNLGLTDLVADTDESFIEIAVRLASDLPKLSDLRRSLRARMLASPLCNGRRFAEDIEKAYRDIRAQ